MTDEKSDLIGLSQSEIYESLIANDLIEAKDKFRAKQIWHWIYNKGEIDFEKMLYIIISVTVCKIINIFVIKRILPYDICSIF